MKKFAELRIENELKTINLPPNSTLNTTKPSKDFIQQHIYKIKITTGIYGPKEYIFILKYPEAYPFRTPKIKCITKIFHPNIDFEGNVCLEFLRLKWTSSMGIDWLVYGIYLILIEPCVEDALNIEVQGMMENDYKLFLWNVEKYKKMKDLLLDE